MKIKHILESQQFDRDWLVRLFELANEMSDRKYAAEHYSLRGMTMAAVFYQPSTRTRFSFQEAMNRLNGNVIATENAREFSSAAKGESLEDTVQTINAYADLIVLRHFEEGASKRAAAVSRVSIINAGDGPGQHPTQALLDLYTIWREFGKIDGLKIAFVGDLKKGRTVRSLAYLLTKYNNIKIYFVSPKELAIGDDIKEYLSEKGVLFQESETWNDLLGEIDVLYVTRIQTEWIEDEDECKRLKGTYVLTPKEVGHMKAKSIVMHPLPRVDEIERGVDLMQNARYFQQAQNGLFIRMALLWLLLGSPEA